VNYGASGAIDDSVSAARHQMRTLTKKFGASECPVSVSPTQLTRHIALVLSLGTHRQNRRAIAKLRWRECNAITIETHVRSRLSLWHEKKAQHKTAHTKSPAVDQISMPVMTRPVEPCCNCLISQDTPSLPGFPLDLTRRRATLLASHSSLLTGRRALYHVQARD
jgi:hypothetical protein